jgi:hypothetical protein
MCIHRLHNRRKLIQKLQHVERKQACIVQLGSLEGTKELLGKLWILILGMEELLEFTVENRPRLFALSMCYWHNEVPVVYLNPIDARPKNQVINYVELCVQRVIPFRSALHHSLIKQGTSVHRAAGSFQENSTGAT